MNDAPPTGSDHPLLSNDPTTSNNAEASTDAAGQHAASTQERKHAQRDQKATMLDHLIRNIDIMIYAQLSALYYMEYVPSSKHFF